MTAYHLKKLMGIFYSKEVTRKFLITYISLHTDILYLFVLGLETSSLNLNLP